mmetsp:Transcript_1741/g.4918  ORF Transcript_1741/g.4918 Transcript_1741/m.4918 type:complete len:376 (-) Transcript_1741:225-1352(-)
MVSTAGPRMQSNNKWQWPVQVDTIGPAPLARTDENPVERLLVMAYAVHRFCNWNCLLGFLARVNIALPARLRSEFRNEGRLVLLESGLERGDGDLLRCIIAIDHHRLLHLLDACLERQVVEVLRGHLEHMVTVQRCLHRRLLSVGLAPLHVLALLARPVDEHEVVATKLACAKAHAYQRKGHVVLRQEVAHLWHTPTSRIDERERRCDHDPVQPALGVANHGEDVAELELGAQPERRLASTIPRPSAVDASFSTHRRLHLQRLFGRLDLSEGLLAHLGHAHAGAAVVGNHIRKDLLKQTIKRDVLCMLAVPVDHASTSQHVVGGTPFLHVAHALDHGNTGPRKAQEDVFRTSHGTRAYDDLHQTPHDLALIKVSC